MDVNIKEVIFEPQDNFPKSNVVIPENIPEEHRDIMKEFLVSGYYFDNGLDIARFLDEDLTINLEKLELAILLIIEYREFFEKSKRPIKIYLRNMETYFQLRRIPHVNIERITEESSFILGFCSSVAEELSISKRVEVEYDTRHLK